ncbi:hypothetical protein GGQ85_002200 [Nitrobacter vulgaris]|nr:hypothetical protein [Nitrobacter vulgaris]
MSCFLALAKACDAALASRIAFLRAAMPLVLTSLECFAGFEPGLERAGLSVKCEYAIVGETGVSTAEQNQATEAE